MDKKKVENYKDPEQTAEKWTMYFERNFDLIRPIF